MAVLLQISIMIISLILIVNLLKCESFTPEDRTFAFQRCRNISAADSDLQAKWALWKFPDKKETHCFIKCFLHKLGLIDLITRGLDSAKFIEQIGVNEISLIDDDNFWDILSEKLSGTCVSYYQKWMLFNEKYPDILTKVFYNRRKDIQRFYDNNPYGAKRKGMTSIEFCISYSRSESSSSETYCHWECVFKHFRYFDAYGRVDSAEVISSFRDYGQHFSSNRLETINSCVHRSNRNYPYGPCQASKELYRCLIVEADNATEVFARRNTWTATY